MTGTLPLEMFKFSRFLKRTKGATCGIEPIHQGNHAVLVTVQIAVAGVVTLATVSVKLLGHGR